MKEFKADLHIHTCLSPCADLSMSPKNIINEAKKKGIQIIGICDHNSAENVPALIKNGQKIGIKVIGGIEITTKEEVHILAFFESIDTLFKMQEIVYENLPEDKIGEISKEQVIANEKDEVLGFNSKLLIGATRISVNELVELIRKMGGIVIASHVDKEAFSIISHLGFIPQGVFFDALEVMDFNNIDKLPIKGDFVFVTFSDAHYLFDIGTRYTKFLMKKADFEEIKKCLKEGRVII